MKYRDVKFVLTAKTIFVGGPATNFARFALAKVDAVGADSTTLVIHVLTPPKFSVIVAIKMALLGVFSLSNNLSLPFGRKPHWTYIVLSS